MSYNLSATKYAIRLNFKGANTMVFQFDETANPSEVAEEMGELFAQKLEFLEMKNANGKSPFVRKGDILPKRKVTIDVFAQGYCVKSALLDVEIKPTEINKQFIETVAFKLLTTAIKTSAKMDAAEGRKKAIAEQILFDAQLAEINTAIEKATKAGKAEDVECYQNGLITRNEFLAIVDGI